jgi:hypothetical protein
MAALFDLVDWVDEENDLSTVIGSGTATIGLKGISSIAWWDILGQ